MRLHLAVIDLPALLPGKIDQVALNMRNASPSSRREGQRIGIVPQNDWAVLSERHGKDALLVVGSFRPLLVTAMLWPDMYSDVLILSEQKESQHQCRHASAYDMDRAIMQ